MSNTGAERRCICGHWETTHYIEGSECVCLHKGCKCNVFFLWEIILLDPHGNVHIVHDVAKFVAERDDLFTPEEQEMKGTDSELDKRTNKNNSLAGSGISALVTYRVKEWHGWGLICSYKTYIEHK